MELLYVYALCISFLIFVSGLNTAIKNKEFNDFIYIKFYQPKTDKIVNKILVIGFLRYFFKFSFFIYIKIK